MKSIKEKLSGVFAPVVTPFTDDTILTDELSQNLKKLNKTELSGYLALGSNGEFKSLSDEEQFKVLEIFAPLHLGAVGGILSLANALPEQCCELYRLFCEGAYEEALELHFRLMRLNSAVSGTYGVAGVKGAMDVCGFNGGEPRHPLKPITEADKEDIRRKIRAEGFAAG